MSVATEQEAQVFSLKTPYLLQGITTTTAAETDSLRVAIKVYAEGGENRMHHHVNEDHSFIVVEGEATFYFGTDDNAKVLHPFEGVMLPAGCDYRFKSSGEQNLVMIRVASYKPGFKSSAFYPDGLSKAREHEPYTKLERIEAPGPGFATTT